MFELMLTEIDMFGILIVNDNLFLLAGKFFDFSMFFSFVE